VPSWQARLLTLVLRRTVKRQLAAAKDVAAIRAVFNRGGLYSVPKGIKFTPATVNGVPGQWFEDANHPSPNRTLLFLHGGGYIACTLKTHRPYGCFFAQRGFRVFMPDYRLAPEHPFPCGLDDAIAACVGLQDQYPDLPLTIAGDSAGGGLALATMLRLKREGLSLPSAAALFSPLTDLTGVGESRTLNNRRCAMFYREGLDKVPGYYAPNASTETLRDPLISPVYGDYSGFPPVLIHTGEDETLRDDSVRLAERMRHSGVTVDFKLWPVVPHDWQLAYTMVPEGRASLDQAAAFLELQSISNPKAAASV
jgi:monoterpene epsilon-lactone hydrolase